MEKAYSTADIKDFDSFFIDYTKTYTSITKECEIPQDYETWTAWVIAHAKDWDLDMRILGLAPSRGSKSTGVARIKRLTTLYDLYDKGLRTLKDADLFNVLQEWAKKHCFYKNHQGLIDGLKDEYAPDIVSDDALLMGDKRRAMESMQVFITQAMERYAKNNARTYTLWQNVTYLDDRFMDGANIAFDFPHRGTNFVYAKEKSALYKTTFGFDRFKKHPRLANETGRRSLSSFRYEYDFPDLVKRDEAGKVTYRNPFWASWENNKDLQL